MKISKFYIFQSNENQQFYFRFVDSNNEIILKSEGYVSKQGCQNGIESVKEHAPDDDNYKRLKTSDGRYYFNLKADNNKVIATSAFYKTEFEREKGINTVKCDAPTAPVEDLTDNDSKLKDEAKTVSAIESAGGLSILPKCDDKHKIPVKPKGGYYGKVG